MLGQNQHPHHMMSSPSSISSCQATEVERAQAAGVEGASKQRTASGFGCSGARGHGVQTSSNGQWPRHRGVTDLLRCLGLVYAVAVKQEADRVCGDPLPVAGSLHELLQRRGLFALEVDLVAVLCDHLEVDVLASLFLLLVPHSTAGHLVCLKKMGYGHATAG